MYLIAKQSRAVPLVASNLYKIIFDGLFFEVAMTLHNDFKNREDSFLFEFVYNSIVANKTYSKDFFLYLHLKYNSVRLHFEVRKDISTLSGFSNVIPFKICNFKINKSDKFISYYFNEDVIESNLFIDNILKSFNHNIDERDFDNFSFIGNTKFILNSHLCYPSGFDLLVHSRYEHSLYNPDYSVAIKHILSNIKIFSNFNEQEQKFFCSLYEQITGVVIDFRNIDKNSEKYLTLFEMLNS